ncbi:MAG: hypothetical protein K0Q79_2193 [Flavipsychrobacter sp.]|jgi:hypothetical protein|nr:hypothetical protein [Flavipsychrobacter sp.]
MQIRTKNNIMFIGKSLLWSLLLYTVMMLAINWDEVQYAINNRQPVHQQPYAGTPTATPANISTPTKTIGSFVNALRIVTSPF